MLVANELDMVEKIQTGLTENYVGYWTPRQALKEAAQNIAYGAMKSGEDAIFTEMEYGLWVMEDTYVGFEKKHLYIGESEQRDDKDGLGNFGEGWKIFMLVMAREGKKHSIDTVGFSAWGEMEETVHGTRVLVINITPNQRTKGTAVWAEVTEEDVEDVKGSFGILCGIAAEYLAKNSIIPNREGELWINGVRIENPSDKNPLDLEYSYNLKNRELMNRDRSQVNTEAAFTEIREVISNQDGAFIREYIKKAMDGGTRQDIVRGPYFPASITTDEKMKWLEALAELHETEYQKLLIPSFTPEIDTEAKYKGYKLLKLPSQWMSELSYIGVKRAADIIRIKPQMEVVELEERGERQILTQAKRDVKKALGLSSVKELPEVVIVAQIRDAFGASNFDGLWAPDDKVIYMTPKCFTDQRVCSQMLLHEAIHWQTGAADNTVEFTKGWEAACMRLLGYPVTTAKKFNYGTVDLSE